MLVFYVAVLSVYAMAIFIADAPVEGWWFVAVCVGAVLVELFLWINVGLPRAVERGSDEFKRAYYDSPDDG